MKKIIITGASDGLGKELAKICLKNKIEVVCISRTKPDYDCYHIKTDLTDEKSIESCANEINKSHPKFDALVNCAGTFSFQSCEKTTYRELENNFKVNVLGLMFLTSQLFSLIKENNSDVLNVSSKAGTQTTENHFIYGSSKWAVRGASKHLRQELEKTKCRVIDFEPGGIATKLFNKYFDDKTKDFSHLMNPIKIAEIMYYILNLPKEIEVSEILINRK